jgi:hypothetical protein
MTTAIRRRRGTTAQHSTFIGLEGETTIDTDKEVVVVHDGTTQGGFPLMRENGSNSALALGSAGTPSLKFTGDTNTGIYSPGADQVAISTNGTGRLFVDASGNVIVSGGGQITSRNVGASAGKGLIQLGDSGAWQIEGLDTGYGGSGAYLKILSGANERLRLTSTGALNFVGAGTAGSTQAVSFNGSAPVNSLVIDSSGRLGLGTSSPNANLELGPVSATQGPTLRLSAGTGGGAGIPEYPFGTLQFYSGDTGGDGAAVKASIAGVADTASSAPGGELTFSTYPVSTGSLTERMRIDSSGKVGIGTTSVSAKLHIAGATGGGVAGIWDTTAGGARVEYKDNGTRRGYLNWDTNSLLLAADSGNSIKFSTNAGVTQHATIDSSGRLLIGQSSTAGFDSALQVRSDTGVNVELFRSSANDGPPFLTFSKSRGTAGSPTVVSQNDRVGGFIFRGYSGAASAYVEAARIHAQIDGEPDTSGDTTDMPGALVFSTAPNGSTTATEALRITNDRVIAYNQAAPAAVDTTATLTVGNLKTGIITSSTAAAVTMTLPTGTDTEAGFSGVYTNMTFEWTVINTGATNAVTVQGGTGHTLVGSGAVAAGVSGRFASRRTAANTFVTYRLS